MGLQRRMQAACVLALMMFFVLVCGKVETKEIYGMRVGIYCDNSVENEVLAPYLSLGADGSGSFSYCGASSHWPMGDWVVENGQMILIEDILYSDETDYRRYVFDIADDTLVFRQDLSYQLWDYSPLPCAKDGSVFVFSETMTQKR